MVKSNSVLVAFYILIYFFCFASYGQDTATLPNPSVTKTKVQKRSAKPVTKEVSSNLPVNSNKTRNSFFPVSYTFLRLLHSTDNFGTWRAETGLNLPGSSYLITTYTFTSSKDSKNESDFRSYSLSGYLFSPHYYDLGLVGNYASAGSAASSAGRAGFYYWFSYKSENVTMVLAPVIVLNAMSSDAGKFVLFSSFSFFRGLISFTPNVIYTWAELSKSTGTELALGYKLWDVFKLVVVSRTSKSSVTSLGQTTTAATSSNMLGLEINTVF